MPDAVSDHLDELDSALRTSAWRRRRIIAEVAEHLADLVDDERMRGTDTGAAAERAVQRFGAPAELADEFNADAARHGMGQASRALAACTAVAVAAAGLSLQPGGSARPWPSGSLFSLAMQLWVQVPAACGALALFLTVVAPRLRARPLTGRPAGLAGRSLALASVLLLPVAVVAVGNLSTGLPAAERLLMTVVAVGTPGAAIWGLRAASQASWLATRADEEDVLDVIAAVGGTLAGRWPLIDRICRSASRSWQVACAQAPWAARWLDLRRHPWRAAASTSAAAGLALTAPDLLAGDPDFLAAGVEAVAVYVCFAVLGGLLGLRGNRARHARERAKIASAS